jgi:Flp pilus assembly protein TadG
MHTKPYRRRRKRQGGDSLLEMALIFIPMIALFFGIVDFSFVIFLESTFESAAREGTRFAITFQSAYGGLNCTQGQSACTAQVVQDNSVGFLSGSKAQYINVNYYTANNLSTPVMTCNQGTCTAVGTLPQTLSSGVVVNYANQPGNIVEVAITNYPYVWMVPIHVSSPTPYMQNATPGNGLSLNAAATDVLGGLAVGSTQPPTP